MIKYGDYTDEELLELQRDGRENVTDYLLDKYKAMVKKKARVLYLMGGEQDDLIQEGMIGLFKAIRDYRPEKDTSFILLLSCVWTASFTMRCSLPTGRSTVR